VFIANTIFPLNQQIGVILFSILVAIWILMLLAGTYFSTRIFVNASKEYFDQHKRRSAITWLLPFLFVFYTIFGIVTGI
jgi:ABC-type multidrug transport system permease subunit